MHIFASEDSGKNFKSGIGMVVISLLQLVWILSGATFIPYFREVLFAIGLPFGIGLIVWSRIQVKRRKQNVGDRIVA